MTDELGCLFQEGLEAEKEGRSARCRGDHRLDSEEQGQPLLQADLVNGMKCWLTGICCSTPCASGSTDPRYLQRRW